MRRDGPLDMVTDGFPSFCLVLGVTGVTDPPEAGSQGRSRAGGLYPFPNVEDL